MTAATLHASATERAIAEAETEAAEADKYAKWAVGAAVVMNLFHLITALDSVHDLSTDRGAVVVAEAFAGPFITYLCAHRLGRASRGSRVEKTLAWGSFFAAALLSSLHQWSIAYHALEQSPVGEVNLRLAAVGALLMPLAIEGFEIMALLQSARYRVEAHDLKANLLHAEADDREAARAQAEADRVAEADRAHELALATQRAEEARAAEEAARLGAETARAAEATAQAEADRAKAEAAALREANRPKPKGKPRPRKPKGMTVADQIVAAIDRLPERPEMKPAPILEAIGWDLNDANRKAAGRARDQILARAPQPLQEVS